MERSAFAGFEAVDMMAGRGGGGGGGRVLVFGGVEGIFYISCRVRRSDQEPNTRVRNRRVL